MLHWIPCHGGWIPRVGSEGLGLRVPEWPSTTFCGPGQSQGQSRFNARALNCPHLMGGLHEHTEPEEILRPPLETIN